ncbi:lactate utilization protein [Desulfosarcina sp.]|uniref:lactate utilization protein n=1 Tax=Desulfosarcina sp. TaxID=2027861 RepID=UPI003568189E
MPNPIATYWQQHLEKCKKALEKNGFEVFVAADTQSAGAIFLNQILPGIEVKTAAWGDSMTFLATGVLDVINADTDIQTIDPFDAQASPEERLARRRQALLTDLFFTGTNAVTESGQLVNLDMVGNRVTGITFGPRHVVLFIGRNKLTPSLDDAMQRVRRYAAPANAIRHPGLKIPCVKTAACADCSSPDRICNTWCITEKSFPKGRIKIILINQDLGL